MAPSKKNLGLAALLGVACAIGAAVGLVALGPGLTSAVRPEASGDLGILYAYGQLPSGPILLRPSIPNALPRPQTIAFQWNAEGTGPRLVRIETEVEAGRSIVLEETLMAPALGDGLDFLLELDDTAPNHFDLLITVEAPHMMSVTSRLPVVLLGPSPP